MANAAGAAAAHVGRGEGRGDDFSLDDDSIVGMTLRCGSPGNKGRKTGDKKVQAARDDELLGRSSPPRRSLTASGAAAAPQHPPASAGEGREGGDGDGSEETEAKDRRVPLSFYCPLTMDVMRDPVVDHEGHSYERTAIEAWLRDHDTSPVTRNPLKLNHLAPNRALKELIFEMMGPDWAKDPPPSPSPPPPPSSAAGGRKRTAAMAQRVHHACRHRRRLDGFLDEIGRSTKLAVRLDEKGVCSFSFRRRQFVVEVPEHIGSFVFYTSFGPLLDGSGGGKSGSKKKEKKESSVMEKMLHWNHCPENRGMGGGAASLSLDPVTDEIVFSFKGKADEVTCSDFRRSLEHFIETSFRLYVEFRPTTGRRKIGRVISMGGRSRTES